MPVFGADETFTTLDAEPSSFAQNFCDSSWRFLITDLDGSAITLLDHLASDRVVTPKLNEPLEVSGSVPSGSPYINIVEPDGFPRLAEGVRQLYCFRREQNVADPTILYKVRASTLILQVDDAARSDDARSRFTAWDPWQYMFSRPVLYSNNVTPFTAGELLDADGLTYPSDWTADQIALDLIQTTADAADTSAWPSAQDCFTDWTTVPPETCAAFTDGFKIQQGTSLGQALQDLCSTGVMDILFTPIYDPTRSGILCEMEIKSQSSPFTGAGDFNYNAIFAWDRPGRSVDGLDNMYDGIGRANVVQFYNGQGGIPVTQQTNPGSISLYGEYWAQQFFPSQTLKEAVVSIAAEQLALRANYKQTLTVNPASQRAPQPLIDYGLGDRVPVFASNRLRQALPPDSPVPPFGPPIEEWQRVYGIPIEIDDNGSETVRELIVGIVGIPAP